MNKMDYAGPDQERYHDRDTNGTSENYPVTSTSYGVQIRV
jgi:hypothetical protein